METSIHKRRRILLHFLLGIGLPCLLLGYLAFRDCQGKFCWEFSPWTLEFYQQAPPLFKTLLTSRRSIYLYMFILLAGILIFGLTLTIRIVRREFELGKMKSDFVSTVSHEFKSPLTSIRQLAEMLQTGRIPSEEHHQRYYDVLLEQSERLSLLTDKILDFAKMEEGKEEFDFETVDMGPLPEELVSSILKQVQHEGFTIKARIDGHLLPIQADRAASDYIPMQLGCMNIFQQK